MARAEVCLQLIGILIDVVGPVFLLAAIGYAWARRGEHFDAVFVGHLVNSVGTPALVLDSLLNTRLDLGTLGQMAFGAFLCMGAAMALGWLFVRAQGLSVSTFLPTLVWSNGGNMGLPLTLFAFGERGLALAIAWFSLSAISNYTVGQAIAARGLSFRAILSMPIMWAIVAVIFCLGTGLRLPSVFMRAAHLLAGVSVPLMLLSLGHSLAKLHVGALPRGTIFATARLFGGFAIGWGVATFARPHRRGARRAGHAERHAVSRAELSFRRALRQSGGGCRRHRGDLDADVGRAAAALPVDRDVRGHEGRSVRFRIAGGPHRPAASEPRATARAMLVVGADGALADRHVRDLPGLLRPGDALVVNDTRVIPARLVGTRARGEAVARIEAILHKRESDHRWRAFVRRRRRSISASASASARRRKAWPACSAHSMRP